MSAGAIILADVDECENSAPATLMACVLTPLAITCAVVRMGTEEMDLFVKVDLKINSTSKV